MLYARFGRAIAEKFLIPYNEKLYACDLGSLDKDAMGRFFPHADLTDIIRNMKVADNATYNAKFTYPEGGAIEYVKAIASAVRPDGIALSEPVALDRPRCEGGDDTTSARSGSSASCRRRRSIASLARRTCPTTRRRIRGTRCSSSTSASTGRGRADVHWVYYPIARSSFYRVGFYDNIFDTDRLSLYVEIGFARDAVVDVEPMAQRVLADLARRGRDDGHRLVADHHVVMDPPTSTSPSARWPSTRGSRRISRRTASTPSVATADGPTAHRGQHRRGPRARRELCLIGLEARFAMGRG